MAAPPRDHMDNRYDDTGGGGYGKFRRRPLRKPHSTPYDRPPAALRNAASPGGGGGRGWLSRLVDPAQRLITSSAHRLFASVFQKRLGPAPPTPPQPSETEPNLGARIERNEAVVTNERASKIQDSVTIRSENPSNISEGGGASELELMLKQQTFTRSEVDRLTTLLQSRLLDQPVGDRGNKTEMLMSSTTLSSKGKERLCTTPVRESEQDSRLISSRYNVGRNLVPEEVSNPAELAKAYMGGGPSKLTPTKNSLLGPPLGENSPAPTPFSQKTPTSELVPSSNGQAVYTRNGFVTPRSLGRSAIYSMARTPYSRGVSANTLQAAATPVDSHGGPSSSSQDTWRNDRSSSLRQGTLKRRSSVFENDIAAVGPIRRIRQKSNLLPASGILSARGTGLGVHSSQKQSLKEKAVFTGEPSTRNGEDGNHGSGFYSVPSESSQMASKILQQLNTLVSTPAKSPTKLSPSMLRGPALRSMENIDSSKFLEVVQDGSRQAVQSDTSHPVPRDSISQKDTVENGPKKFFVPSKESSSSMKDVGASNLLKSDMSDVKLKAISVPKRASEDPDPMKRAFRMSAHEEVDEGDSPTAPPTFTLANGTEKSDAYLVENKINASERSEKLPTFELIQKTVGTSDGSGPEKSDGSMLSSAPFPSATIQQDTLDKQSTEALGKSFPLKDSGVGPSFSTRDSIASLKEPSGSFPIFKAADKVPSFSFTSSPSLTYNSSSTTSESPSSLAVPSHVMVSVKKEPDSKSTTNDALSKPPQNSCASTSSAAPSFSFGGSAAGSSLSTGSLAPSPFSSSYGSSSVAAASLTADATTSSSLPVLVSAPSSTATPIFKFGTPPASSSSALSESLTAAPVSAEAKANGGSFNSMSSVSFSGTSTSFAGTGSSIFGSTPSAVSGPSGLFGGSSSTISSIVVSTPATISSGSAIVSFSSAATALPSNNQSQGFNPLTASTSHSSAPGTTVTNSVESASVPYQFGSSAPSTSFGLAGNAGFSSGSSLVSSSVSDNKLFGSSAPSASFGLAGNAGFSSGSSLVSSAASDNKLFGSNSIFGLPSSAPSSESNSLSSSSSATPSLFGSSWQTPNIAPLSGSSNASPSVPYVFGTGTPSNSAASGTPVMFGSSTTTSTGLPFSFSSPATTPVFGNPSAFGGSSPSGNNDQMSMEDSMAEDSIQTTPPAAALFGQQPIPNTSSGFTYGSGTPSMNPFGSTAPGGASPFQFGGQPSMAAQPNPSPFQASGSLEFAGGSFSLGASGGGGGDKSNRKIVKVRRTQRKR